MPNWKTHLEISKRLNEKYKFNEKDFELFMFGSILPDINNSYVVTGISKKISHDTTHFRSKEVPSYILFAEKYKKQIDDKNPIFVGYVTHLFTDYMWNNNFYTSVARREFEEETGHKIENELTELGTIKQPSKKQITIYAVEMDIDVEHVKSNFFEMEWPPKSGNMQKFPENDKAEWFSIELAREKIFKGQIGFLDKLVELLDYKECKDEEYNQLSLFD